MHELANCHRDLKVYSLSGATTRDLKDFVRRLAETRPGKVIIRCGTNSVRDYSDEEATNKLIDLKSLALVIVCFLGQFGINSQS